MLLGRTFERVAIDDPRLTRPFDPAGGRARARRRARRLGGASRQVSGCSVRERACAPGSPPDDGELPARACGSPGRRPAHACCCQARRRVGRHVPRRSALRHVAPGRAVRARHVPRGAPGRGAARRGFTPAALAARLANRRAPLKAALLDQRTRRGPREHLRRRGALARPPPSAQTRGQPRHRRDPRAPPRHPRRAPHGHRPPGRDAPRLRASRRRAAARCSTSSRSTAARASRATAAARRSRRRAPAGAARGTARRVSRRCRATGD